MSSVHLTWHNNKGEVPILIETQETPKKGAAMACFRSLHSLTLIGLIVLTACETNDELRGSMASESLKALPVAPFAVGSMTQFFHDETRDFDTLGGISSGVHVLPTEIWYPVSHKDIKQGDRHATYGDYVFGDKVMHHRMATDAGLASVRDSVNQSQIDKAIKTLFGKQRNSYSRAPVSDTKVPFPVVIMSHGNGGQRLNMESTAEHLASHGYVVFVPDHTGNASFVLTGRDPALKTDPAFAKKMQTVIALHDKNGAYYPQKSPVSKSAGGLDMEELKRIDAAMLQRVNDLRAILDALPQLNGEGPFKGAINLEQIGVMGRSLGAATTLAALALEPRFKAGVAVVAPSVPDFRTLIPKKWLTPPGKESVMFSSDAGFPLAELSRPTFVISSGEDPLIIKMNQALAKAFKGTMPSAENRHPVLRSACENSKVPVAWSLLKNGNHRTLQVAGSYWWPELKPNRFPRFFAPETYYTLVPPKKAHRFQAEKTHAFFDLILRKDATAKQRLLSATNNEADAQGGMRVEAFNLEKAVSNQP